MTLARLTALFIVLALCLPAQTITGSITGTITDQTALPVHGATVVLKNVATGAQREMQTDVRAGFLFSGLPPGEYTLSVSQQGFKSVERTGIMLTASERLSVGEIVLQLGEVAERVTVTAEGAAVLG
jgi:anthranilate/para-aminobenzoate synthase component II